MCNERPHGHRNQGWNSYGVLVAVARSTVMVLSIICSTCYIYWDEISTSLCRWAWPTIMSTLTSASGSTTSGMFKLAAMLYSTSSAITNITAVMSICNFCSQVSFRQRICKSIRNYLALTNTWKRCHERTLPRTWLGTDGCQKVLHGAGFAFDIGDNYGRRKIKSNLWW